MASGIYMCPVCCKIYDHKFIRYDEEYGRRCPDIECDSGGTELFEIDELMVKPIRILNQKNYLTQNCCSGHLYDDFISAYIMFEEGMRPEEAPKGWELEGENTIRYRKTSKNVTSLKYIMDLIKWCEELPENEDWY